MAAGILLAAVAMLVVASTARADFGLSSYTALFHEPISNNPELASGNPLPTLDSLTPVTQAGAHADFTTDLRFNTVDPPGSTGEVPDEQVKDIVIDLPPGFYGDPNAVPQCSAEEFAKGEGICPLESQVGIAHVQKGLDPLAGYNTWNGAVYNLEPAENETALLGFAVLGVRVLVSITPRTDGDHGLQATIKNTNQALSIFGARMTLWGVPADPVHDYERFKPGPTWNFPSPEPRRPFITLPPRCDGPLPVKATVNSWQSPADKIVTVDEIPALTGCDNLSFNAGISLKPEVANADAPSAYDVDVSVPQNQDPDGLGTPHLKDAVVRLPLGVAISPPSASGLQGCADNQTGIGTRGEPTCPGAAKIGTVSIRTPLLAERLTGDIILRSPKPGNLFRLLIVARGSGMVIKIPGDVHPDKATGQILAVFKNTPQLPFDLMEMRFKGGPRAPLVNPQSCGTKTTTSEFTPWSGAASRPSSSFTIVGCNHGFAPSFEAGMVNPLAGSFSPFTMTIRRPDGHEYLAGIALDMPPGLLGMVASVPQCPEAQAAAGTCSETSRVGTTTVESGSGTQPFPLSGKVFLAGPYKGAPFSLSVAVHAIAGPFDLGMVVVRAPIYVDAANAKIGVPSDPLPTILEGVPLRLKTLNITIDRPGFMFNATNCDAMAIGATITGSSGTVVHRGMPYQARGCAALPLKPELSLGLKGAKEDRDGDHPGIAAHLEQERGESGLKKVAVKLPLSLALDPDNAQALCKPEEAKARNCPAGSIVGMASAVTPALKQPLRGPIYFVENTRITKSGNVRRTLPKLWLALKGEVPLDLYAESEVVDDHLVAEFDMVPDAPISSFDLFIDGGENGILAATENICEKQQVAEVTFDGQNGKRVFRDIDMSTECGFRVAKIERGKTSVRVTVSGLGAGRVEVSGKGIEKTSRTILSSSIARVTARLTKSGRRAVRRNGKMATRVNVRFVPKGAKKAKRTGAKVTFRR